MPYIICSVYEAKKLKLDFLRLSAYLKLLMWYYYGSYCTANSGNSIACALPCIGSNSIWRCHCKLDLTLCWYQIFEFLLQISVGRSYNTGSKYVLRLCTPTIHIVDSLVFKIWQSSTIVPRPFSFNIIWYRLNSCLQFITCDWQGSDRMAPAQGFTTCHCDRI